VDEAKKGRGDDEQANIGGAARRVADSIVRQVHWRTVQHGSDVAIRDSLSVSSVSAIVVFGIYMLTAFPMAKIRLGIPPDSRDEFLDYIRQDSEITTNNRRSSYRIKGYPYSQ
jgi:hypothetical protein